MRTHPHRFCAPIVREQSLEPKQRTTAVLYYYNDMSVREIAQAMGCFEGTVKSRLYHARQHLKESLEVEFDEI